jgi:hypothetical protein
MKTAFFGLIIMAILLFISAGTAQCKGEPQDNEDIRKSILAGAWYPGDKQALTKAIEGYLEKADAKPLKGDLKAIIVPHAGHVYSGPVAAHAYRLLRGKDIRRVIMIGPSHRAAFRGVSVNLQSGYETPLGIVPVDQELAKKIIDADPGHMPLSTPWRFSFPFSRVYWMTLRSSPLSWENRTTKLVLVWPKSFTT